ncbi:MAG: hypothetical protein R3F17_02745 [Planctomycetota bacterium]
MKAFAATLGALITACRASPNFSPAAVHRHRTQVGTGADAAPWSPQRWPCASAGCRTPPRIELYARDYYTAAFTALGLQRFQNLGQCRANHANAVAGMIQYLGGTPVLAHNYTVVTPTTVDEADDVCTQIELKVIAIYAA